MQIREGKHFPFQMNSNEMTLNRKKAPADKAIRPLVAWSDSSTFQMFNFVIAFLSSIGLFQFRFSGFTDGWNASLLNPNDVEEIL